MKSLRTLLLASAPALAIAAPALAADVDDTRTTTINTSTATNGAPDDVTITSNGRIELTSGTGVTLDSNNSVTNNGTIIITGADGAVGVRVLGGFVGSITNGGAITLDEDYTREDSDGDGTLDGPFAQGTGRTGILIEGPAAFTGDISNRGTVSIEGNGSRGVDLQTDVNGNLIQLGTVFLTGESNVGVYQRGDVSGDVRLGGAVAVVGGASSAVVIGGDVGGGVANGGSVSSTGFQYSTASNYFDPDEVPDGFEPAPLDGDDLMDNAPAFVVAGSVGTADSNGVIRGGVLNNGFVGGGAADDSDDGTDPNGKDLEGDYDVNRTTGTISSLGSAPALLISPEMSTGSSGNIVIGLVVDEVRDTTDDDDDDDRDEILATFFKDHGLINRGVITADGLNVGFSSNAIVIEGSQDGTRQTIIEGGILNANTIIASSKEADATALTLGAGAQTPRLDNDGLMRASLATETDHAITVLLIEAGSLLTALDNTGGIEAIARGDEANMIAIRDLSGTLLSISNTGRILADYALDNDDDDGDGLVNDFDERIGEQVAIDLSGHVAGQNVTIVQQLATPTADTDDDGDIDQDDVADPFITGDVRLGAGDDDVQLLGGVIVGDLSLGAGADQLTIDGEAIYAGTLSDSDGQANVAVNNGEMHLGVGTDVTVTTLTLGDQSTSSYAIDLRDSSAASAHVIADTVTIGAGAQITPQFVGIGSIAQTSIEILRAEGALTLAGGQAIASNLAIETPYLFEAGLSTQTDGAAESVVVTVRRKTAAELGMSTNQAAAYEPLVAALNADDQVLLEVVNLDTSEEFFAAYDQLMPEFSLASMQFAVSNMDGAIGAVGNRLDAVRGGRDGAGAAWMQEFGLFLDRESTFETPGYRGNGFGMAAGIDRPFGPFYAVGFNVVGAASEIEETAGFDTPLSVSGAQVGAYAAANAGNLLLDLYAGAGADFFESERRIIVGDVTRVASGDWKAHHATATARLAYDINVRRLFARPAVSVDYFRMDEESYSESGGGQAVSLRLDERSAEMLATTASLTLGAEFGNRNQTWWSPRLRVGYRYESLGDPLLTTAQFLAGGDPFVLTAEDLPDTGGVVGFTFAAGSRWSSFALDYDADVREGFVRHGLRVAFRFIF